MPESRRGRLKVWSGFGDIRRVPSEYEILTHDVNYTTRQGQMAPLESNPTTPLNMWYMTYRDHSPLQAEDWKGFRDPDALIYRKYVTLQNEQEVVVAGVLDEFDKAGHDMGLSEEWLQVLAAIFTPTRFPLHALQMTQSYLAQMAPSSYVTNAAAFGTADLLRRVSLVAYRTRQLQLAHPRLGFGTTERRTWEEHPGWQPARRALEQALVAYDWGECLVGVNLVLRPALDEVLLRQLGLLADANHDELTWLLVGNLAVDSERHARWSTALARYAVERRSENAEVIERWAHKWEPRAEEAAAGLAAVLAELLGAGADSEAVGRVARSARQRVLEEALAVPVVA